MSIEWDVNYLAVVVATLVGLVIGTVYYMPQALGRVWMKTIGKTEEELRGASGPTMYVIAAVLTFLFATMLAASIGWADAHTLGGGALVGLLLWIGLAVPIVGMVFLFEGRKLVSHAITGEHCLIALVVKGAIIGAWGV